MIRAALVLACGVVAACGAPRRDPIAVDREGARPFTFPYVDPLVPVPDAPALFGGVAGTAMGAPTISYPLDGAMHAINIGDITFQWTQGEATNTLFRIRLDDGASQYDFYLRCIAQRCLYTLPRRGWLAIAGGHPDGQLTATVAGTDGAGGPVFQSAAIGVRFSPEAVNGGLYYWTASGGGTTYRLPFGASTATPFIIPGSQINRLPCNGCHSVSRDGSTISFAASADAASQMAYLSAAPTQAPGQPTIVPDGATAIRARFTALNTDGSRVLVTTFGRIQVYDTRTGQRVDIGDTDALMPAGKRVTHPEWSPSGRRVAFTLYSPGPPSDEVSDARPEDGEIVTMELDPSTGKATALRRIVLMGGPGNMFHFYPSWSPDERWLVMAAVPRGTVAYNARPARLRLASAATDGQLCPGPTCYELVAASQGTDSASTWPKLSPFSQSNGSLLFVTFSSKIDYGYILGNRELGSAGRAQLWMSAIDLRNVAAGGDPSLPPVWLPFQNVTQINHLPFWTAAVACTDDAPSSCGADHVCDSGVCRARVK